MKKVFYADTGDAENLMKNVAGHELVFLHKRDEGRLRYRLKIEIIKINNGSFAEKLRNKWNSFIELFKL